MKSERETPQQAWAGINEGYYTQEETPYADFEQYDHQEDMRQQRIERAQQQLRSNQTEALRRNEGHVYHAATPSPAQKQFEERAPVMNSTRKYKLTNPDPSWKRQTTPYVGNSGKKREQYRVPSSAGSRY